MSFTSIIGLISATREESSILLRTLRKSKAGDFFTGRISKNRTVHAISGIGKTNAAHTATLVIKTFSPALIINFGIGGAYPSSGLRTGDIVVASKEIYGDEGVCLRDGFHTADSIGMPLVKRGRKRYFNEFPLDKNLIEKVIKSAPKIKSGTFITVSTSTGTIKKAKEIEKRFDGICENMEGAAVAHICAIYGIPMLEIRGISNIVENRDRNRWDIKTAAENCQMAVLKFLNDMIF